MFHERLDPRERFKGESKMDSGTSKDTRDYQSFSNSSSSCSSPRAKDNAISKEILMRSGGGLQGLLWSKYGLERGKESPLEKRRRERQGRRINSEPVNDLTAALKKDSKVLEENRLRSQSACEVTAKQEAEKATSSQASFEIYDVLGNLTLDPSASLEKGEDAVELPSPSAKTDSPRSPAYQRFSVSHCFAPNPFSLPLPLSSWTVGLYADRCVSTLSFSLPLSQRTDSFDVILSKRIMEKYKNMNMAEDGTLVSTDNSGEDAAERVN